MGRLDFIVRPIFLVKFIDVDRHDGPVFSIRGYPSECCDHYGLWSRHGCPGVVAPIDGGCGRCFLGG